MTAITVTVTPEDLTEGYRNSCTHCPVALAIARACPDYYVSVGRWKSTLHARRPDRREILHPAIPPEISNWIRDFDDGVASTPPAPFTLEVEWPRS